MEVPIGLLGQTYPTSREMQRVVIQTAEIVSIREATERKLKILNITYAKADLERLDKNEPHVNYGERNQLLVLIKYF